MRVRASNAAVLCAGAPRKCFPTLVVSSLLAVGCSGPADAPYDVAASWQSEELTREGIREVRTLQGSIWGGTAALVEELRMGSEADGEPYIFGGIGGVSDSPGRIFILDAQLPVLRMYDSDGTYLRDIGREGGGPAEFRSPGTMVTHPGDGRLFVPDPNQNRVVVFGPDGSVLGPWRVPDNYYWGKAPVVTQSGRFFQFQTLRGLFLQPDVPDGMVGYGPDGASGDSLQTPVHAESVASSMPVYRPDGGMFTNQSVPFFPEFTWVMSTTGAIITGYPDDYAFEILQADGGRLRVSRRWRPVPVTPDERAWYRDSLTSYYRSVDPRWTWSGPEIPPNKPAYSDFLTDLDGRIWVLRLGPGRRIADCIDAPTTPQDYYYSRCWADSWLVDVFLEDGTYLGPVGVPEGFRFSPPPYIKGDMVLAVVGSEEGFDRVVRYRLTPPRP